MFRRPLLAASLAASLLTGGCFTVSMQAPPGENGAILIDNGKAGAPTFSEERTNGYLFWGLMNLDPNIVESMLAAHHAKRLRAVRVSTEVSVINAVITAVTLGIYDQRTVKVEGSDR